jgi:Icc-related predicted phosphoesterase
VIRRIEVVWPDDRAFAGRNGRPVRFLAVSDDPDPALEHAVNREALGPIDGIIGCGDLEATWLGFLADAFDAPLVYVRGNHDHGGAWTHRAVMIPAALGSGHIARLAGIAIGGLEWPGVDMAGNRRRNGLAWRQTLGLMRRAIFGRVAGPREPILVISHAPPKGAGDASTDAYHVGFGAYRWLLDRLRPPVWLHGHTTTALVHRLSIHAGPTTVINVTGAVVLDLCPPPAEAG